MPDTNLTPLNQSFTDDWFKFTDNNLDPEMVRTILGNRFAPSNSPHATTTETLQVACEGFMEQNGDALIQALEHLKKN